MKTDPGLPRQGAAAIVVLAGQQSEPGAGVAAPGALAGTALGAVLAAATGLGSNAVTPTALGGPGGDLTAGAPDRKSVV